MQLRDNDWKKTERKIYYEVVCESDPGVDERIILRRIFRKWNMQGCTGSIWFRLGTGGGHL